MDRSHSFFWQLGKDKENQLSRTLATCFRSSAFFRRQIIQLLHATCRLPRPKLAEHDWNCVTEVQTPVAGGGRLDLQFSTDGSSGRIQRDPVFVIENKVKSKLRREQLLRYKKHKVRYLVALTKHPPEVSERQMRRDGVFALRWQDVHRQLSASTPTRPVDRFLINAFLHYLEDLRMAYPEQLTVGDLKNCRRLFRVAVSERRYSGIDPREAFATADQCLELLTELRRQLVERVPSFERCRSWGPKFFVYREADDAVSAGSHAFGWEFHGTPYYNVRFSCSLWFPRSRREPISWNVSLYGKRVKREKDKWLSLSQVTDKQGRIRQDLLLKTLVDASKRWKAPQLMMRRTKRTKKRQISR